MLFFPCNSSYSLQVPEAPQYKALNSTSVADAERLTSIQDCAAVAQAAGPGKAAVGQPVGQGFLCDTQSLMWSTVWLSKLLISINCQHR